MFKRDFLEKPYSQMNDILLFLYNHQGTATKNELISTFQISLPTLNEHLSSLQFFLIENNIDNEVSITLEGDSIYLKKAPAFPLKNIIALFLDKSIKFQMVQQLFFKNQISCEFFQLTYAISSATYYRKVKELNDLLKEFHLQIRRGRLIGEEKQIRYFFFNFYWFLFEDKTELTKETANQYVNLINILQDTLGIFFDPTEKLQIKLWMKICFKRIAIGDHPVIDSDYDQFDRPLFDEINQAFQTYTKKIDRSYSLDESYMFYDFFCALSNFSPNSSFAFRLSKTQRKENSYLSYMNRTILSYLKKQGYIAPHTSASRLLYIENLLFQFHARLYYFNGFILSFDNWTIQSIINAHRHPFSRDEVYELMSIATKKFNHNNHKENYHNTFAEIHYTIILNHIAELNTKKIVIGVYHSLNPSIAELVIQHILNVLGHKYPIKVEHYLEDNHYDILLSNIYVESIALKPELIYIFSDIGNNYDIQEVEKLITQLTDSR